jgi:hypothetical protein
MVRSGLVAVLERARQVGFLGPGPVEAHIEHANRYGPAVMRASSGIGRRLIVDLGAGAGLPSLPLLMAYPDVRFVLVEAAQRRASFLVWATVELGLADRAEVWCGRAERFGHELGRRASFDAVVARGLGTPAFTLECGGPLLRVGGRLVVSEPPGYRQYPRAGVARAGLVLETLDDGLAVFRRDGDIAAGLPRSAKEQARRPLFVL